jgi:hypothetical protein
LHTLSERSTEQMLTKPDINGTPSLPRRTAPKGMLPSTWLNRAVRIQYTDCHGSGQEVSGQLLDFFPCGPVFSLAGAKTCVSWDRLAMVELVED